MPRIDLDIPDSEVVIGRSKVNAEVIPKGYGRPRGDAGAYAVDMISVGAVPLARLGETKCLDGQGPLVIRGLGHVTLIIFGIPLSISHKTNT